MNVSSSFFFIIAQRKPEQIDFQQAFNDQMQEKLLNYYRCTAALYPPGLNSFSTPKRIDCPTILREKAR